MSLMTVPEVGRLRVDPDYTMDCDWCSTDHEVAWVPKADLWLCDDCYDKWRKETRTDERDHD